MNPRIALMAVHETSLFGLRAIGASLKSCGCHCDYISFKSYQDFFERPPDSIRDEEYSQELGILPEEVELLIELLRSLGTNVLGVTTASSYHLQTRYLTRVVRERLGIPVVWGGADAIVNPDIAIREADVVCVGEGEDAMREIADALCGQGHLRDVPGIWWKDGDGVHVNPPRPFKDNLDDLPFPDWSIENYYALYQGRFRKGEWLPTGLVGKTHTFAMTGRGCPMHCSFCFNGMGTDAGIACRKVRRRSVDNVMAEMHGLKKQFPRLDQIYFCDEVFTSNRRWLTEFCERYTKEIAVPFVCYTFPNVGGREIFELLVKAGLRHIIIGVQSGSDRTNKEIYNRSATRAHLLETARALHELGQDYLIEFIVGNPLEKEEDYRQTIQLLRELPRPYTLAGCYRLAFFRNYALTRAAQEKGVNLVWDNPTVARAEPRKEYDFWDAMYNLIAAHPLSDRTVASLLEMRELRERPEALLEIARTMQKMLFVSNIEGARMKKNDRIRKLERDLATLQGSRFVKTYRFLKRGFRGA